MDKTDSLSTPRELPPLQLTRLHSTYITAGNDGPQTNENQGGGFSCFGYSRGPRAFPLDGTGEATPVPPNKTQKRWSLKRLFHLGKSKLQPLGIGDDYDGQAQQREQKDEDEDAPEPGEFVNQDTDSDVNQNLKLLRQHRDLHVQVIQAKGVRAADSNGLSDPYCKIRFGNYKAQTKVVNASLSPNWNETFVIPFDDVEACLESGSSLIIFELWDRDFMASDDFLGQADLDISKITLQTLAVEPVWQPLYADRAGKKVAKGLGEIQLAVWLAPVGQLGRLTQPLSKPQTKLTTLCSPPGVGKTLPMVVHQEGCCLYEEPCITYLSLHISEIRDLDQFMQSQKVERMASMPDHSPSKSAASASPSPGKGSKRRRAPPRRSLTERDSNNSESVPMTVDALHDTLHVSPSGKEANDGINPMDVLGAKAWSEASKSSKTAGSEEDESDEEELTDDGEDAYDSEENLENPQQVPSSDTEPLPPSKLSMHSKRLFVEVSLGNQRRRTRLARLKDGAFAWHQGLAFATTAPMKNRSFKLLLCEADRQNRRSRLLAIAFVPLNILLAQRVTGHGHGEWFRLHDYVKRVGGKPVSFGAVRMRISTADADERRVIYGQNLLDPNHAIAGQSAESGRYRQSEEPTVESVSEMRRNSTGTNAFSGAQRPDLASAGPLSSMPLTGRSLSDTVATPSGRSSASAYDRFGRQKLGQFESSIAMYMGSGRRNSGDVLPQRRRARRERFWYIVGIVLLVFKYSVWMLPLWLQLRTSAWKKAGRHWRHLQRDLQEKGAEYESVSGKLRPERAPALDRPLGLVKILLSSVEVLDSPAASFFCVFKCGPHWGKSSVAKASTNPIWDWEVHIPLYDPYTLLLLNLFKDQARKNTRRLRSHPPLFVGKLRVRLNTLHPGEQYAQQLPMLADRKQGGDRTAMADLSIKVIYFDEKSVIKRYFRATDPREVYEHGLHLGTTGKQMEFERTRIVLRWLETTHPPIPKMVARSVLGSERQQFVFSRAKANWTRLRMEKERFTWIIRFWKRNQAWENPFESIALMCGLVTFSFYPHIVLCGVLLALVSYSLITAPLRTAAPYHMQADPEDEEEDDEVAESSGINSLRRKYERLVRVALAVQNYLDDIANTLERLHATINWTDPKATLIFLFACLAIVLAIGAFSLPLVLSIGLCWTVRPPVLRSPTPPAPLSYFWRLPTRSDQII